MLNGEKPNCTRTLCRNAVGDNCVWLICATIASLCSSRKKVSIKVVLPAPISPVITTKPSVNQMVDSMYALARACCLLRYKNCGSGLNRNGNSWSLNSSRYIPFVSLSPFDQFQCIGQRAVAVLWLALEDGAMAQ